MTDAFHANSSGTYTDNEKDKEDEVSKPPSQTVVVEAHDDCAIGNAPAEENVTSRL